MNINAWSKFFIQTELGFMTFSFAINYYYTTLLPYFALKKKIDQHFLTNFLRLKNVSFYNAL